MHNILSLALNVQIIIWSYNNVDDVISPGSPASSHIVAEFRDYQWKHIADLRQPRSRHTFFHPFFRFQAMKNPKFKEKSTNQNSFSTKSTTLNPMVKSDLVTSGDGTRFFSLGNIWTRARHFRNEHFSVFVEVRIFLMWSCKIAQISIKLR